MTWGPGPAARLAPQVDRGVAERGREYFRAGAVQIFARERNRVGAVVQGTMPYYVFLDYRARARRLDVDCTCRYYVDTGDACKHVWATILAAEAQGLLSGVRAESSVTLGAIGAAGDPETDDFVTWVGGGDDSRPRGGAGGFKGRKAGWERTLDNLRERVEMEIVDGAPVQDKTATQLLYLVHAAPVIEEGDPLPVEVVRRRRNADGRWGRIQRARLSPSSGRTLPEHTDRLLVSLLQGGQPDEWAAVTGYSFGERRLGGAGADVFAISEAAQPTLVELMCRSGRCAVCRGAGDRDPAPLTWDEGEPWTLWLQVTESPREYTITGSLRRGGERMAVGDPLVLSGGGILVTGSAAARFEHGGAFSWAVALREEAEVKVPRAAGPDLIARLLRVPRLPKLDLPPSLRFEQVPGIPRPHLTLRRSRAALSADQLSAALAFAYEGALVGAVEPASGVLLPEARRFLLRDAAAESAAVQLLRDVGFSDAPGFSDDSVGRFMIAARRMPAAVRALVEAGWHVDAAGQVFRSGTAFRVGIASGIDWFDLRVEAAFGDRRAALPELLEALRRGEATVRLDDGSFGLLPEAWLKQLGMLADLGAVKDGGLRYTRSQAGLLDALLAAQPETTCDEGFAAAREELRRFEGIKPVDEPEGFQGALRPYQRDGLGWLHFLRQFRFGGCLADDMGLGKTVQVLALLESRRERRAAPSLVVVPRSLVFNWMQEAQRFAPRLRVLDHSGAARETSAAAFDGYDVVLTTYGTLRRDVAALCDVPFDYVILDEAQAIKNAATQSAKAVRLLRAEHRLALSGTPVENHVGELWSLFEFLNPGMLGRGTLFRGMDARDPGGESRRAVGRALRPFILRRSKEQVAADLPAKLEQTLYCDLLPRDRRRYDGLRDHYRASVLERVERDGLTRARMHVLEALLRLRQAACHYGLIDKSKTGEPSAKLDVLLPQLQEVIEEGHKALVFSQFTSLLAVVRERLDGLGVRYEYLDGRTRDRQARVDRFQGDPECRLFLVSLKAGGLGLNLTAAEYVFLLDPWWNPAVEAQAVDRAHRIGQTRAVFAFRLIARDTVEEKVLQLQESKRSLARDLISGDDSLVRSLTREDLERLLS